MEYAPAATQFTLWSPTADVYKRQALPGSSEEWCNFTENMRIEVRFKRNAYEGFNDALWFMGNNNLPWPANGEICLLYPSPISRDLSMKMIAAG